jgi:hypothetical protein
MAKAILEYDLNDFDDQMAHKRAIKSTSMALALWEIIYNTKKRVENEIERDEESLTVCHVNDIGNDGDK